MIFKFYFETYSVAFNYDIRYLICLSKVHSYIERFSLFYAFPLTGKTIRQMKKKKKNTLIRYYPLFPKDPTLLFIPRITEQALTLSKL